MVKKRKESIPLIIEQHPQSYNGYPFITLIQYRTEHILSIIDNYTEKEIKCYVLDLCSTYNINEEIVINVADYWFNNNKNKYPLSFEFSKEGISKKINPIYKKFNIDYVSRIIGPLFTFSNNDTIKTKRKRIRNININLKLFKSNI